MTLNGAAQQGAWVLNRATNEGQVRNDINVICCYVKKRLFEKSVVVWNKSALTKNGVFHKDYMKNCKALIADGRLMTASSEEAEGYMNMLWQRVEKLYGKWMAKKRSGTYQAIQDGFMSKWLYRIIAGVLNYWNWVIALACLLGSHLRLLYCCWRNAVLKRTL